MRKIYLIISFFFFTFPSLYSQSTPVFVSDSLDGYVLRGMTNWKIPGTAVLIIKDGEIVVAKGYGVKELGTNDKVDENTLFLIGSNTKAFTGTALALLESEGKIKLENKVINYLPDFRMISAFVTNEINIVDILTHRMGFETFQGDFMYWTSDLTTDEVIEKFGTITPKYDFRTKYGYTNAGYAVAGKIIEQVSGLKWEEYLEEKIFFPLDMSRTTALSIDFAKSENIAKPHTLFNDNVLVLPFENLDNMAPCGSIGSSVADMTHWLIAQLDSGKYGGQEKIPFKVLKRTRKPETIQGRVNHPFNKGHYNLYGLGWGLMDYEGTEIVSHTGGVNGFVTSVTLLPEENLGIVVLTNTDQNAFFQTLKWEIVDAYLGLPYRNYDGFVFESAQKQNESKAKMLAEWKDSVNLNLKLEIPLNDFAGKYKHEVYGYAEIELSENSLLLKLEHHSRLTGKLQYIGKNRFLCTYCDPIYGIKVFPFEIKEGKVKSFTLYVDDFIDFQPYKFVKQ